MGIQGLYNLDRWRRFMLAWLHGSQTATPRGDGQAITLAGQISRLKLSGWLGRLYIASIVLTVLAYGSASAVETNVSALAFALLALFSIGRPIVAAGARRAQLAAILLLAVLLLYAAVQALPLAGLDLANGAWKSIDEHINPTPGAISVAPGMTLDALTSLALPMLAFIASLAFFQGDDEAARLWRALALFGVGYAAFAILQEILFPEQLLFETKKYYVGSLTGSFVNRNTAGTFFGLALLLNFGLGFKALRKTRIKGFERWAAKIDLRWGDARTLVLLQALSCLVIVVALFLTQSRGAAGATFIACVVTIVTMASRPLTADHRKEAPSPWRGYAIAMTGVLLVIGIFLLFAGRSAYRMAEQGGDDARWCAFGSTISAIRDNWLLGTGFGAFQDVFPVYRDASCAGIFGVWERAHNFFLEGYLGLGVPFAIAAVVGYGVMIGVLARGIRTRHRLRFIPVSGLAALLLATLHSLVDFSLQIPGLSVYFAALMGAATTVSLGRKGRMSDPSLN